MLSTSILQRTPVEALSGLPCILASGNTLVYSLRNMPVGEGQSVFPFLLQEKTTVLKPSFFSHSSFSRRSSTLKLSKDEGRSACQGLSLRRNAEFTLKQHNEEFLLRRGNAVFHSRFRTGVHVEDSPVCRLSSRLLYFTLALRGSSR